MQYSHTQHGPMSWVMAVVGVTSLTAALINHGDVRIVLPCVAFGIAMLLVGMCFATLTVVDEGQSLLLRFGPVPLFWKHFRYEAIREAEPAQSSFIDGWGIHYLPGRGWIYNLWGKDCVRLNVNGRTVRIGSDDSENLAGFIQSKIEHVARG